MAGTLKLEIITPDGKTYSDDVELVTIPGSEGEMGVYPQHAPILTQVVPGEVLALKAGEEIAFAIGEGFVEITGTQVSIMTDMEMRAEEIDEIKAEEARKQAEARLAERVSDEEIAVANAVLARSIAQLRVKRRKHR